MPTLQKHSWRQKNPEKSREIWKRWAIKNRARLAQRSRDYRSRNIELVKASNVRYKLNHKAKISTQNRRWRLDNADRRKSYMKDWWAKNKHLKKAYDAKRRAKRRLREGASLVGDLHVDRIISIWKKQSVFICYYCGSEFSRLELHIDHVVPVSKGGHHTVYNVAKSCSHCNQSKRDKLPSEFIVLGQRFLNL
jgi:5-methylcytosine-specific restriction endonuclease McrA